jgi:membrane protease YdiL (CAAX protease family)
MEKLFWWGICALLPLTTGGPEEAYAEGGQNGELNLPPVSTEISKRAVGFQPLVPTDSGTRFVPRSLERGREIFALSAMRNYWFLFGCGVELSLLFAGAMLAFLLGRPLFGNLQWCLRDFWLGILASLPLLALFFWLLHSSLPALERIGEFLEARVRTVFESWAIWELAVISLLAGVCEEVFFRSVLQGGLAGHIGTIPALVVASIIFGCFHLVTKTYAIVATLIGAYLGVLWLATGNLLAPITTHAVYDFVALVYFLRAHVRQHRAARIKD